MLWTFRISLVLFFAVCAKISAASEPSLLLVTTPNCPACIQVAPLVQQLISEGYPVETIDASKFPELVRDQLKVESFPTFLMCANEQIVDRVVGGGDPTALKPRILYMFEKAGKKIENTAKGEPILNSQFSILSSSVKLRVDAENSHSWGTGTIIDTRQGEALILTCGHIFRDSQGKGNVEVHLYSGNSEQKVFGRCLFYDLEIDLALLTITPPGPVQAVPIAPVNYTLTANQKALSIGCDSGANPTVREHRILSTDRIGTPLSNKVPFHYIQVSGAPVSGRSGGGLFSEDGYLLGVCNTADPVENDGQFVPPEMIRLVLQKMNLADIYQKPSLKDERKDEHLAGASGRITELQPFETEVSAPAEPAAKQLTVPERATLEEIKRRAQDGDEVILIVRSRRNPEIPSDVIVLNGTSDQFLNALTKQDWNSTEKSDYNPVIMSSHEPVPAVPAPAVAAQPLSGQRPVSFPVLH
ncbi:MAG: trypsin-like peptidase domain-containing protein [Planctomycetaceae bacterium]|jgi:S1-C subfamily serine protease|nr:trypsin-like peptidase domain-containing protein [Planctomycetaceae bacterium]